MNCPCSSPDHSTVHGSAFRPGVEINAVFHVARDAVHHCRGRAPIGPNMLQIRRRHPLQKSIERRGRRTKIGGVGEIGNSQNQKTKVINASFISGTDQASMARNEIAELDVKRGIRQFDNQRHGDTRWRFAKLRRQPYECGHAGDCAGCVCLRQDNTKPVWKSEGHAQRP